VFGVGGGVVGGGVELRGSVYRERVSFTLGKLECSPGDSWSGGEQGQGFRKYRLDMESVIFCAFPCAT